MATPAADRIIANRYALKTARRPSAMGTVWHAQDTLLGREVAVHEVHFPPSWPRPSAVGPELGSGRGDGDCATQPPWCGHAVRHRQGPEEVFIVTELVQAPTLADLVLAEGPLPPMRVAEIGAAVASVLEAATAQASSTAASSQATFWCSVTVACASSTSASPPWRAPRTSPRVAWPSAHRPMWRRNRQEVSRAAPQPTCGRWARPCTSRSRGSRRSTRAP